MLPQLITIHTPGIHWITLRLITIHTPGLHWITLRLITIHTPGLHWIPLRLITCQAFTESLWGWFHMSSLHWIPLRMISYVKPSLNHSEDDRTRLAFPVPSFWTSPALCTAASCLALLCVWSASVSAFPFSCSIHPPSTVKVYCYLLCYIYHLFQLFYRKFILIINCNSKDLSLRWLILLSAALHESLVFFWLKQIHWYILRLLGCKYTLC